MAGKNTVEFSDASFDQDVLNADVPVLVDFWAEWCGPCKMIAPTVDAFAEEYAGKVKVGKVNVDFKDVWSAVRDVAGEISDSGTFNVAQNGFVLPKGVNSPDQLTGWNGDYHHMQVKTGWTSRWFLILTTPTRVRLGALQQQCSALLTAMTSTAVTKDRVRAVDCDPRQAQEAAGRVFALNAGLVAFQNNCAGCS